MTISYNPELVTTLSIVSEMFFIQIRIKLTVYGFARESLRVLEQLYPNMVPPLFPSTSEIER